MQRVSTMRRAVAGGLAVVLMAGTGTGAWAGSAVTVSREAGVEIITSKTVPAPLPALPRAGGGAAAGNAGNPGGAVRRGDAAATGATTTDATAGHASAENATAASPTEPAVAAPHVSRDVASSGVDPLADSIRGDHRLRADRLTGNATPNEEADNPARRMVQARERTVQADLKDALKSFDDAKRNGAGRYRLDQLQQRIRGDLDMLEMLARSQQN
ncbi:hypothetical protein [Burkholderia anthina]|uniref:hypothetical protein n=1 Tax=Burkholderia anthina TaxID=179879 RepID=UPI0037C01E73